jgi:hypothetical protein
MTLFASDRARWHHVGALTHKIEGEVSNYGHVLGALAGPQARLRRRTRKSKSIGWPAKTTRGSATTEKTSVRARRPAFGPVGNRALIAGEQEVNDRASNTRRAWSDSGPQRRFARTRQSFRSRRWHGPAAETGKSALMTRSGCSVFAMMASCQAIEPLLLLHREQLFWVACPDLACRARPFSVKSSVVFSPFLTEDASSIRGNQTLVATEVSKQDSHHVT